MGSSPNVLTELKTNHTLLESLQKQSLLNKCGWDSGNDHFVYNSSKIKIKLGKHMKPNEYDQK